MPEDGEVFGSYFEEFIKLLIGNTGVCRTKSIRR